MHTFQKYTKMTTDATLIQVFEMLTNRLGALEQSVASLLHQTRNPHVVGEFHTMPKHHTGLSHDVLAVGFNVRPDLLHLDIPVIDSRRTVPVLVDMPRFSAHIGKYRDKWLSHAFRSGTVTSPPPPINESDTTDLDNWVHGNISHVAACVPDQAIVKEFELRDQIPFTFLLFVSVLLIDPNVRIIGRKMIVYETLGPLDAMRRVQSVVKTLTGEEVECSDTTVTVFNMLTPKIAKNVTYLMMTSDIVERGLGRPWAERDNVLHELRAVYGDSFRLRT